MVQIRPAVPPGLAGRATHVHGWWPPYRNTGTDAKVTTAKTRSGNQVARWVWRTRRVRSRMPDSTRPGSSPKEADSVAMDNKLALQTDLRYRLAAACYPTLAASSW